MTPPVSSAPSRRSLVRAGGLVAGAAGAALAVPGRADAAAYTPAHYPGEPLLSAFDRHLVTRTSYGLTPALRRTVLQAGGARAWADQQLTPSRIADGAADALVGWWPSLRLGPAELWRRNVEEIEGGWEVMAGYQRWLLMRRITTNRQVHELMTDFWLNHFNVPVNGDGVFTWRFHYDGVVRQHALGRFADLLQATITHPAMGIYLNNATSGKEHPNENLGRELLELHTVGRGNYSEDDVKSSARILTGYRVAMWDTWAAAYDPAEHWTGPVRVMGFGHANREADGRDVTRRYLDYLAHHPRTAERVVRKLAVRFVGDQPSSTLITYLARIYRENDTRIAPVLRALVRSQAFAGATGAKVRDPAEDVVATYRALGATVRRPTGDESAANAMLWQCSTIGAVPCDWPRPDGQPADNDSWSSPARILASLEMHWGMSGRWWPSTDVTYRTPAGWLPRRSLRFDLLVDHLSQQLLGRRSTSALLQACCQVCAVSPGTVIDAQHGVVQWNFHRLLSTLLDSPAHLTR